MALRVPWNKQEVALLVDAYIKVREKRVLAKKQCKNRLLS